MSRERGRRMSGLFDPQCFSLAEHFLRDNGEVEDSVTNQADLAREIQRAVEGWRSSPAPFAQAENGCRRSKWTPDGCLSEATVREGPVAVHIRFDEGAYRVQRWRQVTPGESASPWEREGPEESMTDEQALALLRAPKETPCAGSGS